jgi:DNA repair exonuclease SbcCD ATPase subunit
MLYVICGLLCLALLAAALFYFFRSDELSVQFRASEEAWTTKEETYVSELAKLEKIRHIPDIIEKSRKVNAQVEARLAEAEKRAGEILQHALEVGQERSKKLWAEAETLRSEAKEALRVANAESQKAIEEAQTEARELASKARKETKEKREKAEVALNQAITYALEIRQKAERRAEEIAGLAYEARGKVQDYEAMAQALRNRIEKYQGIYIVPPTHILDELADEFQFNTAGVRLKIARERSKMMQANGTAATCGYPDGWKKEHALKFVLSTFNGKVDTVLSRIRPSNQGRLIQEIKDAYAQVNSDGEVYKNARIQEEYLESRLEEVKWGVAVQKLKERLREEQRAIRDQIREEQRAKKEIEKAIKQAEREEELVNRALTKLRKQLEETSGVERANLEAQLDELNDKLAEAEERGRRAISMAQQTRSGHVYIISNIGSFGENVYKVGMTRRLEPTERVRELGDASVPFPFDVHAILKSEDAPALETALHRRFVERQVNKVNRRREFFRVSLKEIREVVDELGVEGTWTLESEASQYRETLALEAAMRSSAEVRKKWLADQATFNIEDAEFEDAEQALEEAEA